MIFPLCAAFCCTSACISPLKHELCVPQGPWVWLGTLQGWGAVRRGPGGDAEVSGMGTLPCRVAISTGSLGASRCRCSILGCCDASSSTPGFCSPAPLQVPSPLLSAGDSSLPRMSPGAFCFSQCCWFASLPASLLWSSSPRSCSQGSSSAADAEGDGRNTEPTDR